MPACIYYHSDRHDSGNPLADHSCPCTVVEGDLCPAHAREVTEYEAGLMRERAEERARLREAKERADRKQLGLFGGGE